MTLPAQADATGDILDDVLKQLDSVILGKPQVTRMALAGLLARGHLLLEDLPGMGKTTLAHALALTLGLDYQRIQFTSDLLPADILGASIYDRDSGRFVFHPGPVFAQLVLADEVNRATPKTQSALLEAMEERQVTAEGETRPLPEPFFVIATQNPTEQLGTFPLPESQLDRFLLRLRLGYPDAGDERALLAGADRRSLLAGLRPVLTPQALAGLQASVDEIAVAPALVDYVQRLLAASRERATAGLSPRAGIGLLRVARAWALLAGRGYVLPEDVQQVLPALAGHRLQRQDGDDSAAEADGAVAALLAAVAVPV